MAWGWVSERNSYWSGQGQSQQRLGVFDQKSLLGSPLQGEEAFSTASPPLPVSWVLGSSSFPTSNAQNLHVSRASLTDLGEHSRPFPLIHLLSLKSWHFWSV